MAQQRPDPSGSASGTPGSQHGTHRSFAGPPGQPPADPTTLYDSNLRLALALIRAKDWGQLAARTGIESFAGEPQFLSLFVEIVREQLEDKESGRISLDLLIHFELLFPTAYLKEFAINPALRTLAVRIELMKGNPGLTAKGTPLDELLAAIANDGSVRRIRLAIPHGACLQRSLRALDLPPRYIYNHQHLSGEDIVVGIIDDGCAFAHPDFLDITLAAGLRQWRTRVLTLWDQSQSATLDDKAAGWADVADFGYGRELPKAAIDAMLAQHTSAQKVDEDAVYDALRYAVGTPDDLATHGTRVMGIAAGNGNSAMGWHGVAPRADIVFVQLPPYEIRHAPKLLSDKIVHAVQFVFQRAADLGRKAAVVNISYGGYAGPHDGTSHWEMAIDDLLGVTNRAVVVSAGNGFEADCHAMGTIAPETSRSLRWCIQPYDSTRNDLEIWYNGDASLALLLETPDGSQTFGPYPFCPLTNLVRESDGAVIGSIEHVQTDPTNGDNSVLLTLGPTAADTTGATNALALIDPGTWIVRLVNIGTVDARFHGWIQRDDVGPAPEGRHQQSRFHEDDAAPEYTIGDFATGRLTISAGAFNAATGEVCAYSASGPTRPSATNPSRAKPDVLAPAEELATGGGVLTSASRRAAPRRLNGTSASAPHVAGIIALVLDYRRNHQHKDLSAAELRAALAVQYGEPIPNRRAAAGRRKVKQQNVWGSVVGAGRISCRKTLDNLP